MRRTECRTSGSTVKYYFIKLKIGSGYFQPEPILYYGFSVLFSLCTFEPSSIRLSSILKSKVLLCSITYLGAHVLLYRNHHYQILSFCHYKHCISEKFTNLLLSSVKLFSWHFSIRPKLSFFIMKNCGYEPHTFSKRQVEFSLAGSKSGCWQPHTLFS